MHEFGQVVLFFPRSLAFECVVEQNVEDRILSEICENERREKERAREIFERISLRDSDGRID